MDGFRIREAHTTDSRLLTDMMVAAANGNSPDVRSRMTVLADRRHVHYVAGWQRPGDVGSVAEDHQGAPVGACWIRLFPATDPGYGFVASGVPELILGVNPQWRARGVGRALLEAVLVQARAAGHARVSLSVERSNFAIDLYRTAGFFHLASHGSRETMVHILR